MAKTDIEIAQEAQLLPIVDVAKKAGLTEQMLEPYGYTKAKVDIHSLTDKPQKGKLILVSAINPTPAGEGKTTTSVGLADAMNKLGHNTLLCLRLVVDTPKLFPWKTLTYTLRAIFMPLVRPTICVLRCWITTLSRVMPWVLIPVVWFGSVAWT